MVGKATAVESKPQHVTHSGGCHCGRVRFEVDAPAVLDIKECNCSVCCRVGYLHLIVERSRFRLLSGERDLTEYRFNTRAAKHLFCSTCGVKSYYVPRSHPDRISVNARCLDPETVEQMSIEPFDGRNWEANIGSLAPLVPEEGAGEEGLA